MSKLISIIILISFIITISLSSVIHSSIDFEFFYAQENVDSDTTDKFNLFFIAKRNRSITKKLDSIVMEVKHSIKNIPILIEKNEYRTRTKCCPGMFTLMFSYVK